jgi:hypothetical protein
MAFSLLENILSTCTSSNNPLPESPPTTIILFPMTVAACYTRRRKKRVPTYNRTHTMKKIINALYETFQI